MIVEGKKIAEEIISELGNQLAGLRLGIVVGVEDPATESFIKIKSRVAQKLGVEVVRGELPNLLKTCDGIIVQLPHPNAEEIIDALPPEKDVDAVSAHPLVTSPVAGAISEVFKRTNIAVAGKRAMVVGHGRLVGAPAKKLLEELGATVTVLESKDSLLPLIDADIVILGAGSPGLIRPEMLKPGVVLIDAGTSESQGRVVGDATPECAKVASVFTPVPGGIGPIAVAMIFKNLLVLKKQWSRG